MSIIDMRTITCNGPNCDKTVAFSNEAAKEISAKTEWLKALRIIQTADGRNFCYCSDTCEVEAVTTGLHNPPAEKKIIAIDEGKANLAMAHAKKLAEVQRQSDQALKSGSPIHLE